MRLIIFVEHSAFESPISEHQHNYDYVWNDLLSHFSPRRARRSVFPHAGVNKSGVNFILARNFPTIPAPTRMCCVHTRREHSHTHTSRTLATSHREVINDVAPSLLLPLRRNGLSLGVEQTNTAPCTRV